jgi:hypothetical protein
MSWSACLPRSPTDLLGPHQSERPAASYTMSWDIIRTLGCGRARNFRKAPAEKPDSTAAEPDRRAVGDVGIPAGAGRSCPRIRADGVRIPAERRFGEAGRRWSDVRDLWLGAAKRLSTETGHAYLFCPRVDPLTDRVIGMRVKISHDSTMWYPGRLYRRDADKPPTVVSAGASTYLTRSKALMREAWTHVNRP